MKKFLALTLGKKFFDFSKKSSFPLPDFFMCLMPNIFDFVLKIEKNNKGLYYSKRIDILCSK